MDERKSFCDLDHILKVINSFLEEKNLYWIYEKKIEFVKQIHKFNNYL
jgi:hypothetical protein